jgi:hypothetical protein
LTRKQRHAPFAHTGAAGTSASHDVLALDYTGKDLHAVGLLRMLHSVVPVESMARPARSRFRRANFRGVGPQGIDRGLTRYGADRPVDILNQSRPSRIAAPACKGAASSALQLQAADP